jgi:hypothetical protein
MEKAPRRAEQIVLLMPVLYDSTVRITAKLWVEKCCDFERRRMPLSRNCEGIHL